MKFKVQCEFVIPDGASEAIVSQFFRSMDLGLRAGRGQVMAGHKESSSTISYQGCVGTMKIEKVLVLATIAEVIDVPLQEQKRRSNPAR